MGDADFIAIGEVIVENSPVHVIAAVTLDLRVDLCEFHDVEDIFAFGIGVLVHGELILGQCSSLPHRQHSIKSLNWDAYLVAAKNTHSAEILNRVETLDDSLLLGKLVGGSREIGVDDGGQHFGNKTDCDTDAEKRRILPVSCYLAGNAQNLDVT